MYPSNPHVEPPLELSFLLPSSKDPDNGPLSHWAHIFWETAPSPIPSFKGSLPRPLTSSHQVTTLPSLRATQFLPAPQHPSFRLGPALAPPQPVPTDKLGPSFLTQPPDTPQFKKEANQGCPPPSRVHCIPTAWLVLASWTGFRDLPGVPDNP